MMMDWWLIGQCIVPQNPFNMEGLAARCVQGYTAWLLLLVMDLASGVVIRTDHSPERGSGCSYTGHFTGH
jgi:hypothetical protein